jgi:hypothetical protein
LGRFRSIGILLRADRVAVFVPIAAIAIISAVVAIGSGSRGADRRRPVDASANCGACYRAAICIAASCNCISATGNAVTAAADADCSAADAYGASMKASTTAVTAATAPTCERIIRREAGADQNDCCQCSEGNSKHDLFSCPAWANNANARGDPHPGTAFNDERREA